MQYRFFYVKAYRFRVVFPIFPVGAAICRPPEREAFPLKFPHNVRIIITYYLLPLTSYLLPITSYFNSCRLQKRQRRFPLFFRVHAEYNRGIAAR